MQALLGQKLSADINLIAQILILLGLWIGFIFARQKNFKRHRRIQTIMVLVNSFFILFVMFTSFYSYVIRGGTTTSLVARLMIAHGILGLLAELTGIYLILRMNTELIPAGLRVANFKLVMRILLGLWTLIVIGGFAIYALRYRQPPAPTAAGPGAQLAMAAGDLPIHAGEMQEALQRGNFATAQRHAEHLVNLIEGKQGPDYGDPNRDGSVEDPGDGTGLLALLDQFIAGARPGASDQATFTSTAGQARADILKILEDAKAVLQANDLTSAARPIDEAVALAAQVGAGGQGSLAKLFQQTGQAYALPTALPPAGTPAPQQAVVAMKDYVFVPKRITVKAGTTVMFINQDPDKHTVTSDEGVFSSGDMDSGQTFSFTFNQPGTYPYYCVFHGDKGGVDMAGVVEVVP